MTPHSIDTTVVSIDSCIFVQISHRFLGEEAKKSWYKASDWMEAVKSAESLSRLCVLMEILDNCVMWNKSVENTVSVTKQMG